ncbi:pectate lyase-like adhesive domain-containing protein, partial [Lactobacillus sp. B4026]|uniref:pectate lyase-like adhesive domain-containing protein n=1 Tax=Lactobacillus sp. B4026 TaxID=2818035 RepID=UPI00226B72BA
MKRNSNLIEETKNTNYKMHKSKKGWLVSYSLLTFMLGGIYLGSSSTAPVKAADIDNQKDQKGVDQDLQKTVESKSLEDAKLNASTTINTEATTIKEKINSDLNLSSSKKAQQVKKVDALVTAAKTKVDAAANLADVKAVIEETVSNIDNAYEPGSVVTKAKSTAKKSTKKAPVISKNVKPASKKVGVTTYKGLSSFFKSASTSNGVTATNDNSAAAAATTAKTDKSEATSSLVADSAANSATDSAKIAANNATTNTKVEGTSDNKAVDKRSTNDVTAQDEATPRIDTAADTDGGKAVAVGNDPDGGRNKFETDLNNPAGKTKTSVDVPTPDQVLHPEKYNQDATQVATVADFIKAWNTATTSYINVTSDLTFSTSDRLTTRSANAKDIVINGNGHTIDLKMQNFRLAPTTAANPTTITLTNATFKQGLTNWGDDSNALVSSTNGAGLQVNIDNINLLSNYPDGSQYGPNHVLYAAYAGIKFSGNNHFDLMNEVTRSVTYIEYANNSYVKMTRRPGTSDNYKYSEFWVNVRDTTGRGNKLIMGDGSTNDASTASGISANYPAYYDFIGGMTVGDNVTWKQTGFQYFVDANREAGYFQDARFDFGENFTLSAPVTVQDGVIKLGYRQQANFAAGTKMEVNQNAIGAILQVNGTSSISFISPKALHLAMFNASGNPINQYSGIFTGTGTVSLNDSSISTWNATNVGPNSPDNTAVFTQMSYQNGTVTLKDLDGKQVSGSKIVSNNTRELQTNAISVGTMSVQYVDQFGKVISTVKVPVTDKDNFIGQSVPFITKEYAVTNMPKGYMWAIGNQVYSGAVKDPTVDTIDQYGQAKYGIVPMRTDTSDTKPDKTYTIYVYGTPQKVSYQYVDYKTNRVLTSPLSGKAGTEAVGGITPANYGNTIDWTNKYYKTDNVPAGYHYSTQAATDGKQPTTTQVTDNNPLVTIFVEGNEQTIPVSFVDLNNTPVSPISGVTVTGVTGQTMTIPEAPEAINSQLDHIELNGKTVKAGDTFEMPDQTNLPADQKYSLKYVYGPLDKSGAKGKLDDELKRLNDLVDNNVNLTQGQKAKIKGDINTQYQDAINEIASPITDRPTLLEQAKNKGIAAMDKAYEDGVALETNRNDQKNKIDAEATTIKKAIDDDPTLTTEVKNKQKANVDKHAQLAKENIDKATDAKGINDAFDEGKTNIDNDHVPGDSLGDQRAAAKKQLEADAKTAKDKIAAALDLDNEAK